MGCGAYLDLCAVLSLVMRGGGNSRAGATPVFFYKTGHPTLGGKEGFSPADWLLGASQQPFLSSSWTPSPHRCPFDEGGCIWGRLNERGGGSALQRLGCRRIPLPRQLVSPPDTLPFPTGVCGWGGSGHKEFGVSSKSLQTLRG